MKKRQEHRLRIVAKVLILIIMIALPFGIRAQDGEKECKQALFRKAVLDTNYIRTFKNRLMISFIGNRKYQHLEIASSDGHDNLRYLPNSPYGFGVGFSYKWLTFDLAWKLPYLTKMWDKKGETDIFRWRLGYNRPKIWLNTFMQFCRGFYLHNVQKFEPDWFQNHDTYPLRPDILNFSWYSSLYYSFNHRKISYQSAMGCEQRQLRSAGTFLIGGSVFANYLSSDSSMVPPEYGTHFSDEFNMTEMMNLQYGINCGYAQTIIIYKGLFVSLFLFPGIHYQTAHCISPLLGKKDISGDFGSVSEARAVLGYNSDKYFGGVSFTEIGIFHFPENRVLSNGYGYLRFFVGSRFPYKRKKDK